VRPHQLEHAAAPTSGQLETGDNLGQPAIKLSVTRTIGNPREQPKRPKPGVAD
jgi:hypothetical protein